MKIALAQLNSTVGNLENNKNKILQYVFKAQENSADIVLFPKNAVLGGNIESLSVIKNFHDDVGKVLEGIKQKSSIPVLVTAFDKNKKNVPFLIENNKINNVSNIVFKIKDKKFYCILADDIKNISAICEDRNMVLTDNLIILAGGYYYKNKPEQIRTFIKKVAKEKSVNVFYINMAGAQDGYVYEGGSFSVLKNGNFNKIAKLFEEDFLITDTEVDIDVEQKINNEEEIYNCLILGLKDYCAKNGFKKVALGVSGGIDSALVATIAVDALGSDNVLGVLMPSKYTSKESMDYSIKLCKNLKIKYETVPIDNIYNSYINECPQVFKDTKKDLTEENIQARIRGNVLMTFSNKFGYFILCTCNKSEDAVGYSTLYGDMTGGYSVIGDLLKKDVYALSNYRNTISNLIPVEIIKRPPTAELRENQKDSDSLPEYDILDDVLEKILEKNMTYSEIINSGIEEKTLDKIYKLLFSSEYKRRQSPISTKVTKTSFIKDIKFPMTNKYICKKN